MQAVCEVTEKSEWPEVVGMKGKEAAEIIKEDNPCLKEAHRLGRWESSYQRLAMGPGSNLRGLMWNRCSYSLCWLIKPLIMTSLGIINNFIVFLFNLRIRMQSYAVFYLVFS
uniref:Uncharacterized protein n=1 Tax=Opuntia streptacantha TaxID=393608 RepID=A0A7C8ZQ63_OPUST